MYYYNGNNAPIYIPEPAYANYTVALPEIQPVLRVVTLDDGLSPDIRDGKTCAYCGGEYPLTVDTCPGCGAREVVDRTRVKEIGKCVVTYSEWDTDDAEGIKPLWKRLLEARWWGKHDT